MSDALYLPDGDGYVGTILTQGGWHPDHQHGGPVQGLIARRVEAVPTLAAMQVTRLTFDMIRPVPIGPRLDIATRVVREGKKIQLVEAILRVGDVEHVRATVLRLRVEDVRGGRALPTSTTADAPLPGPDRFEPVYRDLPHQPAFLRAIDMVRFPVPGAAEGVFGYWVHLTAPLVAGEETSALSRLCVAGDFTNTIGVLVDHTAFSTINADVNVQVLRPPVGEWVAVVGDTRFNDTTGLGISVAELHDLDGVCAIGTTSQLVQLR
ncbi:MAG: hypothetical protein JWO68_3813 [Actinomycetia bacterium]|nr:hypothetical protein [Actinomycetes bacterium]